MFIHTTIDTCIERHRGQDDDNHSIHMYGKLVCIHKVYTRCALASFLHEGTCVQPSGY